MVLGNAFGRPGLTVDTHFQRLVRRWQWTEQTEPDKIEAAVGALFPKSDWTMLSHHVIFHGRRICHARKPACGACPVAPLCPAYGEGETDPEKAKRGTATGLGAPVRTWRSGPGMWETPRTRLTSGDFNDDGKTDVAAYYDYPGADAAAFIMRGTATGLSAPTSHVWRSGAGNWDLTRTRLVGGGAVIADAPAPVPTIPAPTATQTQVVRSGAPSAVAKPKVVVEAGR